MLTSFADFLPTVIDLADNQDKALANDFDGKSLLGIFSGISSNQHKYLYGVGENQGIQNRHIFPQRSIYDGRFNYIYNFNSNERLAKLNITDPVEYYFLKFGADKHKGIPEEELYDTLKDPFEMHNLAGKSEFFTLKSELKAYYLDGWNVKKTILVLQILFHILKYGAMSWMPKIQDLITLLRMIR